MAQVLQEFGMAQVLQLTGMAQVLRAVTATPVLIGASVYVGAHRLHMDTIYIDRGYHRGENKALIYELYWNKIIRTGQRAEDRYIKKKAPAY